MSRATRRLLGLAIAVLLGVLIYRHTFGVGPVSDAEMDRYLAASSDRLNRGLPRMVDSETQLVSTTGLHRMLQYNYRLIDVTFSSNEVSALRNNVRPGLVRQSCATPQTRTLFLKRGIVLRYAYTDRSGYDLFTIDVAPRDCGF